VTKTVLSTSKAAKGVFETLLVADGAPVELGAHLGRLAASIEELFGAGLPDDVAKLIDEGAGDLHLGRLRVTVVNGGEGLETTLATAAVDASSVFPIWDRGADLSTIVCAGGLGPHKWADRTALGTVPAETVPLLLDRGGEVLEAGRANVFAAIDGRLVTPPLDGRILPGIARAGAIATAGEIGIGVDERTLDRDEMLTADEVFLTGSVRGVEPARSLDGAPLPSTGEISRRVAAGLRRRWRL
jgi:branched-subunit amino acid aminotransferase/4-amino-4-deoxychorismate lyase